MGPNFSTFQHFWDQCDFKTNWENYLKLHKRAEHLGKTFSCPHCEYSSKYKLNVKNHIRGSHSNERHPCHQCAKESKWVQALKQHIDCAHKGPIFSTKIKHKEKEVLKLHTKYLDIVTDMETVGSSYTVVDEITKGVTEERLARTEAGGRLKRKKDKNQNHGARDQFCLISKRLHNYKMAANTRSRDRNDGLFWRENYVRMDSCFLQEINKKNKIY